MKLDRLLAKHESMGRNAARREILAGRVTVDGAVVTDHHAEIDRFCAVIWRDQLLQAAERALHVMLHKPMGVVCATIDKEHRTVIDLIDDRDKHTLHIVGRLDRNTSGLVLLTNDGRWSKRLMHPDHKVAKVYRVETDAPVPLEAVAAFERGFYFHTEDITTLPARLEILGERQARVTLHEGRYHQIKRMFHRVGCRVVALHRESIGGLQLPDGLAAGEWLVLSQAEADAAWRSGVDG